MIDSRDNKIIDELRKNSRASVRDIARRTGLRPSTVHSRMQRLKEEGIIEKYTIKLDNKSAGESFIAFMLISADRQIDDDAFRSRHIKEVFGVTGDYDLLLKLKFKDIEEFNRFIIDFRKKHNIRKTHTMISTIAVKEEI